MGGARTVLKFEAYAARDSDGWAGARADVHGARNAGGVDGVRRDTLDAGAEAGAPHPPLSRSFLFCNTEITFYVNR